MNKKNKIKKYRMMLLIRLREKSKILLIESKKK